MTIDNSASQRALQAERVRLHGQIAASSVGASLLAALALSAALSNVVATGAFRVWALSLGAALALRLAVAWSHRRAGRVRDNGRWLTAYRLCFSAHGLAWALAGTILMPGLAQDQYGLLLFGLTAITTGSLIITSFDVVAAAVFGIPAFAPVVLNAMDGQGKVSGAMGAILALFLLITVVGALRAQRTVREAVRLRVAAAERADEARAHAAHAEQAHGELAEQHHLLSQLLQSTSQGFWFIDNDGITTEVNPAMCILLGRPREAVVGHEVGEFFGGDDLAVLQAQRALRARGLNGAYEIGIVRPDGTRVHCMNNATPISDTHGRQIGSIGLWTDLTARREAETVLRTYEVVANSMTDPVSVTGEDDIYRMVNDAWCRATGVDRAQALGRPTRDVLPADATVPQRLALIECLESNAPRTVRSISPLPGLLGRTTDTTYYPYGEDVAGVRCVVMVTRDVTEQEQSRSALAAGAEYLRGTLNATGDAIFASDSQTPNEPLRFVNEQMLGMWGIPAGKAGSLTPGDIMAYAMPLFVDAEAEARRVAEIIACDEPHESHVHLRDGRVLLRRCIPAQIQGRTARVWSFRDITAQERAAQTLRDSESEVRRLLDAFPGYIAAIDQDYTYTYVNDRLAVVLGAPAEQTVGRHVRDVIGDDRFQMIEDETHRARATGKVVSERTYPATGSRPRLDLEVTHVIGPKQPDGQQITFVFGQDITERKRAKEALIAARDEAERASHAKTQFLSQMSHELRTPMNAIIGFGQLLESDPEHPLSDGQNRYVQELLRGARYLLNLINEVLDLGRIEAGKMQIDRVPVAMCPLVESSLNLVHPLAVQRGIVLVPPDFSVFDHDVLADRTRLKQVLINLLTNAIKYNRDGGRVTMTSRVDDGMLRIEVSDEGRGLSLEQRRRLFQPFERLDADRKGIEGTGIGLALSRRLTEMMRGEIGVDSTPGEGSTFWVRLPLATTRQSSPHVTTMSGALDLLETGSHQTVLYIEDNAVNIVLMEAMLARLGGVNLVTANLPQEGLDVARRELPALVLLDIQLPGMDGFEVLRRLRADASTREIPVIAVSANAMESDLAAGLAAGFDAYLTKPLDMPVLHAAVRQALAQQSPRHSGFHTPVDAIPA